MIFTTRRKGDNMSSYAITPDGKKINVTIKDGVSYLDNGKKLTEAGEGYTVQTGGGIFKVQNGQGVKVDSHNTAPSTKSTKTTKSNASVSSSPAMSALNSVSNQSPSFSYGYDPTGTPFDVEIRDGVSYIKGTNDRPTVGSTIQTKGGIFKLGDDFKGMKVDSHNSMDQFNLDQQNQRVEDIWNAFEDYMNSNKQVDIPKGISAQEATKLAKQNLEGLYNNSSKAIMEALDENALARGFYGQVPQDAFKNYKAEELENQKNSSIASLASQIQGQSEASAMNRANAEMSSQQNELNKIVQALSMATGMKQNDLSNILSILGYKQNEKIVDSQLKDSELNRELKIADYTGKYKGNPTLAYEMWMKDVGFKEEEIAQRKQQFEQSTALSWSNYNLNKDKFEYAKEMENLGNPSDLAEFRSAVAVKAQQMTDDWFAQYGEKDQRTDQIKYDKELWDEKFRENMAMLTGNSLETDPQTGR